MGAITVGAQQAAAPAGPKTLKSLSVADYALWRSIQTPIISADGQWVAWVYTQLRREDKLYVRHVDSGREIIVERASRPVFSDDGQWVAYAVAPPLKDVERLQKDKKPVPQRAELMNLETGAKVGWDNMASFAFSKTSTHFAAKRAPAEGAAGAPAPAGRGGGRGGGAAPSPEARNEGTNLLLRDLRADTDELIGSVAEFAFNKSGRLLAYTVEADGRAGNGLYLADLANGVRRAIDTADANYTRLTWSEDGGALAALRGKDDEKLEQRVNTLVVVPSVAPNSAPQHVDVPPGTAGIPDGYVISDKGTLSWSDTNDRVFLGIKEQRTKPKKPEDDWLKASDVDIFHWNDDRIQSVQRAQANTERNKTDRAVFLVAAKKIVRLTDSTIRSIQLTRDGRWGVAVDDRKYVSEDVEPRAYYYRVEVETGERTPIAMAQGRTLGLSPDSRHFLYWKGGHVWAYELAANKHANLTAKAPVSFVDVDYDHFGEKPSYGVTGYAKDSRGVILTHQYDLWLVPYDGSAPVNLTGGAGSKQEIRFRYVRTDPEERFIDLSKPLLLSAYGWWTKKAGYYELSGGELRPLVYEDKYFARLEKATKADRYLFTRESWIEFPDLHVAGAGLGDDKRITDANPQQAEYKWGHRIFFEFKNKDGVRLQGTLAIPDDYAQGQRLPMLVDFYEKNSQNLHHYPVPRYSTAPQFADYVSRGYLAMQPDIHFRIGSSHSDMLECVEAAVKKVIEMGYADPAHVGLHGHSYSGGGAAYISTRSKMFAAVVAGAAPIDLVSEFNTLFRGNGENNHSYDIRGQGRYGTNPYDNFDLFWQQSPISGVRTMNTPLLQIQGDADPTVEYLQGMEFYNALRFNKKPTIFLSYPGEGHSLSKLENQVDFLTRMEQFYGHYLRGEPVPAWMTDGERFIDKDRRAPIKINVEPPKAPGGGGEIK
jgi:hypothetical protein